jgi:hypothetical protein
MGRRWVWVGVGGGIRCGTGGATIGEEIPTMECDRIDWSWKRFPRWVIGISREMGDASRRSEK